MSTISALALPAAPRIDRDGDYRVLRQRLISAGPQLAKVLPERRPAAPEELDAQATLAILRRATATRNEGLLIIGWGDGSAARLIAADPVGRAKFIHWFILPGETDAFAYGLGDSSTAKVLSGAKISLHFPADLGEALTTVQMAFSDHGDIARLAGTVVVDDLPVTPSVAALRATWLAPMQRLLAERFDCLGNDVYDTFLGAKHALMQGRALWSALRSDQLANRFAGAPALCIASGPSGPQHFARIRELQHSCVVICADSILGGLLKEGIEPDFVCMVERTDDMHKLVDAVAGSCRSTLLALPVIHPSSRVAFGDRLAWWWSADDLYPWIDPDVPRTSSGRSAGTLTVAAAGMLGCTTAYLIGHDLAFSGTQSHAATTADYAVSCQAAFTKTMSRSSGNYYARILDVPRNGGGTVETSGVWNIFRSDIEAMVAIWRGTSFVNLNALTGEGAVIAGTKAEALPIPGKILDKTLPTRRFDETAWQAHRTRARQLAVDFATISSACTAFADELSHLKPLDRSYAEVEALAARLDITKIADAQNRRLIAYVFRAALRNLMVKLHYNTQVRTLAERTWNQIQVMRLFAATMPPLIARLQPELTTALEPYA